MIASIIMIFFWIGALWFSAKMCIKNVKKAEDRGLFNDE